MRRAFLLVATLLMVVGMMGPAAAHPPGTGVPEHGHILVLHVELPEDGPPTYGKCIDLAAGQRLSRAHHGTLHQGPAGDALAQAGHFVIPTRGEGPFAFIPWTDCASFADVFGPPRR